MSQVTNPEMPMHAILAEMPKEINGMQIIAARRNGKKDSKEDGLKVWIQIPLQAQAQAQAQEENEWMMKKKESLFQDFLLEKKKEILLSFAESGENFIPECKFSLSAIQEFALEREISSEKITKKSLSELWKMGLEDFVGMNLMKKIPNNWENGKKEKVLNKSLEKAQEDFLSIASKNGMPKERITKLECLLADFLKKEENESVKKLLKILEVRKEMENEDDEEIMY